MSDILVIGGGIAGVSAAARLSALGAVTLVEAEDHLAHHASGRSAALFEETYGKPSTVALNRASRSEHESRGVLSPRGLMLVAGADEAVQFDADLGTMEMTEIGVEAARGKCPILDPATVVRAAWHDEAWDIDTDALIQSFLRELRANGGTVHTKAPVTAIERTAAGWRVETPVETFEPRIVVNAAGAWVDRIAAMAAIAPLGVTPYRRSMARIPAPEGSDPTDWPMVMGAGESWYMKPDAGALIVSPAEEHPAEPHDAWADDMVLAEGLARYEARVTTPVTRLLSSWAGLRTFAPDRQLVIGPDLADSAFVWCAGQGGYGFQTSPAASALLADLVAGRAPALAPDVVTSLTPGRLRG